MADVYDMNGGVRGQFIIINNQKFAHEKHRDGSGDAVMLKETFENLGFEVKQYDDQTCEQMISLMEQVGSDVDTHSKSNCFGVAVLTHRDKLNLFGTNTFQGKPALHVIEFIKPIRACEALAGKPKLCFVQSGCGSSSGDTVDGATATKAGVGGSKTYNIIPQMADFVFALSFTPFEYCKGEMSNELQFTRIFCGKLDQFSKNLNLVKILTLVNDACGSSVVADRGAGTVKRLTGNMRQSCFMSTLTKELYLTDTPDESAFVMDQYPLADPDKRGVFIIINNIEFDRPPTETDPRQSYREGADEDGRMLKETLTRMNFSVDYYEDQTKDQMGTIMKQASRKDYSSQAYFAMFVLTHGEEGRVAAKDDWVDIDTFVDPIRTCKSLTGKPKLFFIQACQGTAVDSGHKLERVAMSAPDDDEEKKDEVVEKISMDSDMLYAFATPPSFFAWRRGHGSWFVLELCSVLKAGDSDGVDVISLLTRVNKKVAFEYISNCDDVKKHEKKEVPCILSTLTKNMYL